MSDRPGYPLYANGQTIGRVERRANYWIWTDSRNLGNNQSYDSRAEAEMALGDAYWAAVEEFGRDAYASQAHI